MPRASKVQAEDISKASTLDQPERWKLGEIGSAGLNIFSGVTQEELKSDLNFPNSINTYKLMTYSPAVNAALSLKSSMVNKTQWRVIPPKDATEEEKNKAEIVSQMLFEDMDKPFGDFLSDAMTMQIFGFSVVEKVYRRRTKSAGSAYNDSYIAPKKLALRHQQSIQKFIFSDNGEDVIGVKQVITNTNDPLGRYWKKGTEVVIPRSKFLHFTAGGLSDNPFGTSPLRNVYLPWKYLSALEELEAVGIQKELHGIPVFRVPAQYMSSDAPPEQKAAFEAMKNIGRNLQAGSQSCVFLPSNMDPESRAPLFNVELLSTDGKRSFDISTVKSYYQSNIFIGLSADLLLMGNTNTGSFSLGTIKNTLVANDVEQYVKKICNVLNEDLIREIYELNGWDVTRRCKLDYEGFEQESLDEIGKFIQRTSATSMLTRDLDTINFVRNAIGLDPLPEGTNLDELLTDFTSKSGEGMVSGLNSGTGNADGSSGNASDVNSDNAA